MAEVELTVLTELSSGMDIGVITVDRIDVVLRRGKGRVTVDGAAASHRYRYWYVGPPGGTFAYEIKRGEDTVVKKRTVTIDPGERMGAGHGTFKLS